MSGNSQRLSKQIIEHIDPMRRDVIKRSAASLRRINQPIALTLRAVKPHMAGEFGEHGLPDGSSFEQLLGALHLGIKTAIVSDPESFLRVLRSLKHRLCLSKIHGQRLFAKRMPARTERLEGLRRVQKYGRSKVDCLRLATRIRERFLQRRPHACV